MGTQTTAGTVISIGPAPATQDVAGFNAVAVDPIGFATSMSEFDRVYNTASYTALEDPEVVVVKTSYGVGTPSIELVIDDSDTGQIAARAALISNDRFTIKITRQDLSLIYLLCQVSSFPQTVATDSFETGSITLMP